MKKVLIVDDEKEIVDFMARFLKRLNIDSKTAISGEQALEFYKADKYDCVFLDIHLGGIDGIEVLKQLKLLNSDVKVVVITGSIGEESKEKIIKLGAIDYLQKPIVLSEFKEKIKNYV